MTSNETAPLTQPGDRSTGMVGRKHRRGTRAAILLGVTLLGLGGTAACGMPTDTDQVLPARFVEQTAVSDAARQAYGDRAVEAYREVADWSLAQWLRDPMLAADAKPGRDDFAAGITDRLTPGAQTHWLSQVDKALAGDRDAQDETQVLRFHPWQGHKLRVPGDTAIESQAISEASVGMAPADEQIAGVTAGTRPLTVSFTQTARLQLMAGRDPYPATLRREVTYLVVPAEAVERASGTTPGASSNGSPSVGTQAPAGENDTNAKWAVAEYDGTVEVEFDKEPPSRSPSGDATN